VIRLKNNQRGFTLIEVLVVVAITGLLAGGISALVFQVLAGNAQTSAQMTAVKDVEKAIHSITLDVQTAQNVSVNATSTNGFPLNLTWVEWDNTANSVTYSLKDGQLQRRLMVVSLVPPATTTTTTVVVRNINVDETNCNLTAQGALMVNVTSSIGGLRPASETRSFMVISRAAP
jgi:prepilin-type N-terminal cleavage/methylation domain-containing protein